MLDTYLKNRGATKTIIHNNNHNDVSEIKWDADYDGDYANISLDLNQNGKTNHYDVKLDNEDLANMLNIPSVDMPIHKRLNDDFNYDSYHQREQQPMLIEIGDYRSLPMKSHDNFHTHISSPLQNEELLVPLSIDKKTLDRYTFTPKKQHKKLRTHKTHRFYKHHISSRRTKNNRGKTRSYRKNKINRNSRKIYTV
jgi:hypothetical protein